MISFDLKCDQQHRFEGWFRSNADYDAQLCGGFIACPTCGSVSVSKELTPPNVGRKGNQASITPPKDEASNDAPAVHAASANSNSYAPASTSVSVPVSATPSSDTNEMAQVASSPNMPEIPKEMKQAIEKIAKLQQEALKDSQWVGREFAEEARAIHYGESESRIIHGETSPKEAKELAEEGVSVAPLLFPHVPPEAKN